MDISSSFSRNNLPETLKKALDKANVFYSENYFEYLKVIKKPNGIDSDPVYLYSDNYVMLANLHKKYIFRYASIPVEYVRTGEQASDDDGKLFLEACMKYLKKKLHIQWTAATNTSALFSNYPSSSLRIPFGSHIIDLSESEENIWSKIHSKHRNVIRKAEKSDVTVLFGGKELLEQYMVMDEQTWKRSGKHGTSKSSLEDLFTIMKENALLCLAIKNGEPQGGAIFIYNQEMAYYLFGATKDQPESGAMNLLHWKTIARLKNEGVKKYSFVGCRINEDESSKYHDIQRFKERFGGELFSGFMFKTVFNQPTYMIFNIMQKLRKSPDPIDQEIHKWKDLNKR